MLKQRIVTAILLAALMLTAIFFFPPLWFNSFIGVIIVLAAGEWAPLAGLRSAAARLAYIALCAVLVLGCTRLSAAQREYFLLAGCLWWILAFILVRRYPALHAIWKSPWLLSLAGLLVLIPGWVAVLQLRASPHYAALILLLIGLVAAADIGAYFSGRRFGRHKLAPQVSPNKTWEGMIGGMLCCCLLALLVYVPNGIDNSLRSLAIVLVAALAVAVISVVGDLFESLIKRQAGVKDSGRLLPGHGGILDRIDSIAAALPLYTLALDLVPL